MDDQADSPNIHDPIVREILRYKTTPGVLVPLKTASELREEHATETVLIVRVPLKTANPVITMLRTFLGDDIAKSLGHLRRCAKPNDLPPHVKTPFMNESTDAKSVHISKSQWIYILLGVESAVLERASVEEIKQALMTVDGMDVMRGQDFVTHTLPVPRNPPTSQILAAMWTQNFWPTVYRKTNPLGPHPAMIVRQTEEIQDDAAVYMALAHQVAQQAKDEGLGEAMGACIVQREDNKVTIVALAADARYHNRPPNRLGDTGNAMAHSVMRAISMVAQKLVRAENKQTHTNMPSVLEFEAFQDGPVLEDERLVFEQPHPNPDGYLCHGLELYLTHEPCIMCSMAMLHSRMGKVIFRHRMPLTGGLGAEDRGCDHPTLNGLDGGKGLGLFWRRELNWSLIAWEWECGDRVTPLTVDHAIHA